MVRCIPSDMPKRQLSIGEILLLHIHSMEWPAAVQNPERPDYTYRSPFHRVYLRAEMYPIDSAANHIKIDLIKLFLSVSNLC